MTEATARVVDRAEAVATYKRILRTYIDRRPSGTRQKIALTLGKHKSFVSQITNPSYASPVPAPHLNAIFEICHFSPEERKTFLGAYAAAHPRQGEGAPAPSSQDLRPAHPRAGPRRRPAAEGARGDHPPDRQPDHCPGGSALTGPATSSSPPTATASKLARPEYAKLSAPPRRRSDPTGNPNLLNISSATMPAPATDI